MQGITTENIHYWQNTRGCIMVSNENTKELTSHYNIDMAIDYLYANGFKQSAREINERMMKGV